MSELFVPGRLCLFGEHSDWAGVYRRERPELEPGLCLVMGTDQGLRARCEVAADVLEIRSELPGGAVAGPFRVPAEVEALADAARGGGFFAYAAGVAAEVAVGHGARGLRLHIEADLPVKKGLSSSAAVSVMVARALGRAHDLRLSVRDEIELAYRGERRTGSACGRMDQVCAFGRVPTFLRFDGDDLDVEVLRPGGTFHLLVVDLGREKDTRRILRDLNACYPDGGGTLGARVRDALGPRNRELAHAARGALLAGDAEALGALMREAQERFDADVAPACPDELRAPALHAVLEHPAVAELTFGGKGVGSQGEGSVQLVARGAAEREALAAHLAAELGVASLPLTVEADPGAGVTRARGGSP